MTRRPLFFHQDPESGSGAPADNITHISKVRPGPKSRESIVQELANRFQAVAGELVDKNLTTLVTIQPGTREATETLWQRQGVLAALIHLEKQTNVIFAQE